MDTMIGEILDSELVDSTIYTKVLDSGRIWLMILSFPMFRVSDPVFLHGMDPDPALNFSDPDSDPILRHFLTSLYFLNNAVSLFRYF